MSDTTRFETDSRHRVAFDLLKVVMSQAEATKSVTRKDILFLYDQCLDVVNNRKPKNEKGETLW